MLCDLPHTRFSEPKMQDFAFWLNRHCRVCLRARKSKTLLSRHQSHYSDSRIEKSKGYFDFHSLSKQEKASDPRTSTAGPCV